MKENILFPKFFLFIEVKSSSRTPVTASICVELSVVITLLESKNFLHKGNSKKKLSSPSVAVHAVNFISSGNLTQPALKANARIHALESFPGLAFYRIEVHCPSKGPELHPGDTLQMSRT